VATPVYSVADAQIFQQNPAKHFIDFGYFRQFTSRDHLKSTGKKIKTLIFQSDAAATDRRTQISRFITDVSHKIKSIIC
jgi:hypothetical protein